MFCLIPSKLHISREKLANNAFLDKLGETIKNAEVSIVTSAEQDQDGNEWVKVKWLNPRGTVKIQATSNTKATVASLFGGKAQTPSTRNEPPPAHDWVPSDSDVPF